MHPVKKVQHRSSTRLQRHQLKLFLIFNDVYQIVCDCRQPLLRLGDQTSQQITNLPIFLSFLLMGLGVLQISVNTRHSSLFKNYPFLMHLTQKQIPQKFETFYLQLLECSVTNEQLKQKLLYLRDRQESQCETCQMSPDFQTKTISQESFQTSKTERASSRINQKKKDVLHQNGAKSESVEFQEVVILLDTMYQQFLNNSKKFLTIHPSFFHKVQLIHPNSLWIDTTSRWFQSFFHKTHEHRVLEDIFIQIQKTQDQIPRKIQGLQTQKMSTLSFDKKSFDFWASPLLHQTFVSKNLNFQPDDREQQYTQNFLTFFQTFQNSKLEKFLKEKQKIQNHLQDPHARLNLSFGGKSLNAVFDWEKMTRNIQSEQFQKLGDSQFLYELVFQNVQPDILENCELLMQDVLKSNAQNISKSFEIHRMEVSSIDQIQDSFWTTTDLLENFKNWISTEKPNLKNLDESNLFNRLFDWIQELDPHQVIENAPPLERQMLTPRLFNRSVQTVPNLMKPPDNLRSFESRTPLDLNSVEEKNFPVVLDSFLKFLKQQQSIHQTINSKKFLKIQHFLNQKRKIRAASIVFYENLLDQRMERFLNSFNPRKNQQEQRSLKVLFQPLILNFSKRLTNDSLFPIQWKNFLTQVRHLFVEKSTNLIFIRRFENVLSSVLLNFDFERARIFSFLDLIEFELQNIFNHSSNSFTEHFNKKVQIDNVVDLKSWTQQDQQRIQKTLQILKNFQWKHLIESERNSVLLDNHAQHSIEGEPLIVKTDSEQKHLMNQILKQSFETLDSILEKNFYEQQKTKIPLIDQQLIYSSPRQLSGYFFADLDNRTVANFLQSPSQTITIALPLGLDLWDSNFVSIFSGPPLCQFSTLADVSTKKDPWFDGSLNQRTQNQINLFKYQQHLLTRNQKNSQFFEIREKLSEYSWSILFFFSSGWFFVNIFRDLYKKYAKEMIESCIDFLKRAGILEKGDVQWIKEELGLTPIDKGYRGIRHQGKKLKNITGMDHLILQVNEMVWFLKTKKLIPRPFFVLNFVHFVRKTWISVRSVREQSKSLIDEQQSPNALKPKGFLFAGPPGTGKTLLVQAIAGETGVPVVTQSGGLLQNPRQRGRGAKTLHKLFLRAREIAPCIIFIDEVDGIGKRRQFQPLFYDIHGRYDPIQLLENEGSLSPPENLQTTKVHARRRDQFFDDTDPYWQEPEFTQTIQWTRVPIEVLEDVESSRAERHEQVSILTQLLIELDGIRSLDNILVIGATNRLEILDPALMRPGRFQRILKLSLPDYEGRVNLLKFYTKKIESHLIEARTDQEVENVSWDYFAKRTHGFSSADIASIVFASELTAIQRGTCHTSETLERGLDLITSYTRDPLKDRFQKISGVFQDSLDAFFLENFFYFFEKSKRTRLMNLIQKFSSIQRIQLSFFADWTFQVQSTSSIFDRSIPARFKNVSQLQQIRFPSWIGSNYLSSRPRSFSKYSIIFSLSCSHTFQFQMSSILVDF